MRGPVHYQQGILHLKRLAFMSGNPTKKRSPLGQSRSKLVGVHQFPESPFSSKDKGNHFGAAFVRLAERILSLHVYWTGRCELLGPHCIPLDLADPECGVIRSQLCIFFLF